VTPLFLTTPELLYQWWGPAEKHLERVVREAARGEFTTSDLYRLCSEGRALAAIVRDGDEVVLAVVIEFIHYPQMTACNVMALGGSRLDEVVGAFFVTFKRWLYGMGVTVIEASCSPAMARLLGRVGFSRTYEVVRMEC
jgi:hypothetical protein